MYQPGSAFAVAMDPRKKQEHIQMALQMMANGRGLFGLGDKEQGGNAGLLSQIGGLFRPPGGGLPSAPTMQPFTPAQLPGPVSMLPMNPGATQIPMPGMQPGGFGTMPNIPPQVNPGVGMMPQYRNLGFGPMRWS